MENLNAEQVKKALECCIKNQCENCCQCGNWHEQWNCMTSLMKNALALITSQEQRIKKLTEENERLTRLANLRQRDLDNANDLLFKVEDEIERLKAQKYYIHSDDRIEMIPTVESVRADTVRKVLHFVKERAESVDIILASSIRPINYTPESRNAHRGKKSRLTA